MLGVVIASCYCGERLHWLSYIAFSIEMIILGGYNDWQVMSQEACWFGRYFLSADPSKLQKKYWNISIKYLARNQCYFIHIIDHIIDSHAVQSKSTKVYMHVHVIGTLRIDSELYKENMFSNFLQTQWAKLKCMIQCLKVLSKHMHIDFCWFRLHWLSIIWSIIWIK